MRRWHSSTTMTSGITTIRPAAIVCVYGMTCGPAVNLASATVGGATLSLPLYKFD